MEAGGACARGSQRKVNPSVGCQWGREQCRLATSHGNSAAFIPFVGGHINVFDWHLPFALSYVCL